MKTESIMAFQEDREALQVVAGQKVFFAHQSVGRNILDGISEISSQQAQTLKVLQTSVASAFADPVFAHAQVGQNSRPMSKLYEFEQILDAGVGAHADVALLKFCYADIEENTDVRKLTATYEESMSRLKQRYPRLTLVHVTVPLKTVEKGLKTSMKKLTGLGTLQGYGDNIRRNEFNVFLRTRYQGTEPIFDLASIESTAPDGTAEIFSINGRTYQALFPGYTSDGGHLSGQGRQKAAQGLIKTIATTVTTRGSQ